MELSLCRYPQSQFARCRIVYHTRSWAHLSGTYSFNDLQASNHLKSIRLSHVQPFQNAKTSLSSPAPSQPRPLATLSSTPMLVQVWWYGTPALAVEASPLASDSLARGSTRIGSKTARWMTNATTSFVSGNSVAKMEGHDVDQLSEVDDVIPERTTDGLVETTRQGNDLAERANDLGNYLDELKDFQSKVESMIGGGDRETASALVKANYKSLTKQLNQGNKGLEQVAMLEILVQLSLMLQDGEAVRQMLNQMKDILVTMEESEPFLDAFLEHMGSVYMALGNKKEALACYKRSLCIQESIVGENSPELVGTLLALAGAYTEPEEREKGKAIYNEIVHILESSKGIACEELGAPLMHLGYIFLEEENPEEAEICIRRALNIAEKTRGKGGSIGVATCGLARVKHLKGDYSKAAELYQNGLDILKKSGMWSSGDLALESMKMEAAEFFSVVGRTREAQDLWEEVLHEKERLVGVNSPRLVVHLQNLATSYAQDGMFDRCEPLLRRSLKLVSTSLGPTAPQVSIPLEFLATTLHHLNHNKEAESLARQCLSIREKNFPDNHLLIGEACNILASVLHANKRNDEALKLARRALHIKETHLGKNSKELALVLDLLLEIMDALGKTEEAVPVMDRLEELIGGVSSKAAP